MNIKLKFIRIDFDAEKPEIVFEVLLPYAEPKKTLGKDVYHKNRWFVAVSIQSLFGTVPSTKEDFLSSFSISECIEQATEIIFTMMGRS